MEQAGAHSRDLRKVTTGPHLGDSLDSVKFAGCDADNFQGTLVGYADLLARAPGRVTLQDSHLVSSSDHLRSAIAAGRARQHRRRALTHGLSVAVFCLSSCMTMESAFTAESDGSPADSESTAANSPPASEVMRTAAGPRAPGAAGSATGGFNSILRNRLRGTVGPEGEPEFDYPDICDDPAQRYRDRYGLA